MGAREERHRRKYWRDAQKRSRAVQNAMQQIDTPSDRPLEQSMKEPTTSRRALAGERARRKTRKRHSREIKALKEKIEKLTKPAEKAEMVKKEGSNER